MKRSLIPMAIVLSIVSLSLNGPPAYGDGRGHREGARVSRGFSGGRHFASMPPRGGQMFTRNGMGTWSGQHWSGGNWSGRRWGGHNWSGGTWGGNWHHHHNNNDVVFIGDFGFPWWWGSYSWGWGYPYGYYDYSYPYNYYGYGYGNGDYGYGYGYGNYGYGSPAYDYGNGYPYGGYYGGTGSGNGYPSGSSYGSYYGGTGHGNDYPTHSRVAELQRRLTRAGYYSGAIDGIMGPATREAIHAWERDHGYGG